MKNIVEFPPKDQFDPKIIEQEAVEWLVRLDGDSPLTQMERGQLSEWMSRSPEHAKELKSLNTFSKELLILTELNIPLAKPVEKRTFTLDRFLSFKSWTYVSAVFVLAIFIQQMIATGWISYNTFDSTNGYYESAIGEHRSVPLADGSEIVLNTGSKVQVEYKDHQRIIYLLKGEAHFNVAKNANSPFRVIAGQGQVRAVGTAFTVYLRGEDVDVLVTEGEVELSATSTSDKSITTQTKQNSEPIAPAKPPEFYLALPVEKLGRLEVGEAATIVVSQREENGDNNAQPQLQAMDANTKIRRDSWRQGIVLFAGDTLEEVVAEISRYSPVAIDIVDPELKKLRIGGQFQVGDLNGMFQALEYNFGLKVTVLENKNIKITAGTHSSNNEQKY